MVDRIRARIRAGELKSAAQIKGALKVALVEVLTVPGASGDLSLPDARPGVILVVGVNGGGKTTTIGKLAHKLRQEGASVRLISITCPSDTSEHDPCSPLPTIHSSESSLRGQRWLQRATSLWQAHAQKCARGRLRAPASITWTVTFDLD